jgi:hypothetical protein
VSEFLRTLVVNEETSLQTWEISHSSNCTMSQELVAYTCYPSCSGGRDREDHDSKPDWAKTLS